MDQRFEHDALAERLYNICADQGDVSTGLAAACELVELLASNLNPEPEQTEFVRKKLTEILDAVLGPPEPKTAN